MSVLLTTAISYTNGKPHIGHLYEAILADFLKRWHGIVDHEACLLTGTDEHGKKIETVALSQHKTPKALCDENSALFRDMCVKAQVSFDHFIRTTDAQHIHTVQEMLKRSIDAGDVYLSKFTGWYSVREESFVSDMQASQTDFKDPLTGAPYDQVSEEAYFFRLSRYGDAIQNMLRDGLVMPQACHPDKARLGDLKDLCISRTSFSWGIPFPGNLNHVVYVWFDALLNYVTGNDVLFNERRPHVYHLIGKDITWFHTVIYLAMLKSCGLDRYIPKHIVVHGFVVDENGQKMSKSIGNVVEVDDLLGAYPLEAVRFYFIHDTVLGQDIKFSVERMTDLYNNSLIKNFGNLFQRLYNLIRTTQPELNDVLSMMGEEIILQHMQTKRELSVLLDAHDFEGYRHLIANMLQHLNRTLTHEAPWKKMGVERARMLAPLIIGLDCVMHVLYPAIPQKICELRHHIGWGDCNWHKDLSVSLKADEKIRAFELIPTI